MHIYLVFIYLRVAVATLTASHFRKSHTIKYFRTLISIYKILSSPNLLSKKKLRLADT